MKFLAALLLTVVSLAAKDIREIRFPFGDERELSAFIAHTERELDGELQQRVWRNSLRWMREESDRKKGAFWTWLRGMPATDMMRIGYGAHLSQIGDTIEALAKEARSAHGEEATRLKARVAELSKARDAIADELAAILHREHKGGGVLYPSPRG